MFEKSVFGLDSTIEGEKDKPEDKVGDGGLDKSEGRKEKPSPVKVVNSLSINAKVPWERLSSYLSGVIRPLKDKNAQLQVTIDLKAFSEEGFDRTTLDSRVKETLLQIGAQIELWQEN